jgi:hypothetical protein
MHPDEFAKKHDKPVIPRRYQMCVFLIIADRRHQQRLNPKASLIPAMITILVRNHDSSERAAKLMLPLAALKASKKGGGYPHLSGSEKHLENSAPKGHQTFLRSLMCGLWPANKHHVDDYPEMHGRAPTHYYQRESL